MDQSQERLWKIGQVADRAGVSVDTVRYYERRGLVTPAHRASSRYRYYRPDAVDRILLARSLQALGMTLDEITQALQDHDKHGGNCASQRWRLEAVRERITAQLAELTAVLNDVDVTLANCASGNCTLLTTPPGTQAGEPRPVRSGHMGHGHSRTDVSQGLRDAKSRRRSKATSAGGSPSPAEPGHSSASRRG